MYSDLAVLNEIKVFIRNLAGERLRTEAETLYKIHLSDYDSESELREAMIAIEERNYFK